NGSITGGSESGSLVNTINNPNANTTYTLSGAGAGSFPYLTGTYSNIQNITSTGNNTLIADNGAHTWTINGAGSIALSGVGSFTNISNFTGGSGDDNFIINSTTLSGSIDGGTGSNTITGS